MTGDTGAAVYGVVAVALGNPVEPAVLDGVDLILERTAINSGAKEVMLSARVAREAVVAGTEVSHLVQPAATFEVQRVVYGNTGASGARETARRALRRRRRSGGRRGLHSRRGRLRAADHRVVPLDGALHVVVALRASQLAGAGRGRPVLVREHVHHPCRAAQPVVQAQRRHEVRTALDSGLVNRPRAARAVGVFDADGRVVAAARADAVAASVGAVGVVDVLHDVAVAVDRVVGRAAVGGPDAVALGCIEVTRHMVDRDALDAEGSSRREVAAEELVLVRLDVREICHVSPP